MVNINYGREYHTDFGFTVKEFKEFLMLNLKKYLFEPKSAIFEIPNISIDENGCLYSEGQDKVYVSPEYFTKKFIERTMEVYRALSVLNPFQDNSMKVSYDKFKKTGSSIDNYVGIYNVLATLRKRNQQISKGLIGLGENIKIPNTVINLRKIEIAASAQRDIETVLDSFLNAAKNDLKMNCDYNYYDEPEYKELEKEHHRLFKKGSFIDAMERPDYLYKNDDSSYDEGTAEDRDNWEKKYNDFKERYKKEQERLLEEEIDNKVFSASLLQDIIIKYLKVKIIADDSSTRVGDPKNPYIDSLGLDQIAYHAHPSDKYSHRRNESYEDLNDINPEQYDYLFGYQTSESDELLEYAEDYYHTFKHN